MSFVWAGLLAALSAWSMNGVFAARLPYRGPVYIAPFFEEAAKTGFALLLGAAVLYTHLIFGLCEAVWDALGGTRRGLYAGLAGVLSHGLFGVVSALSLQVTGWGWAAILAGYLIHVAHNYLVLRLAGGASREDKI